MNECKIVEDLMPLYADDLTSPETVEFIDQHLLQCAECRALWNRCAEPLPNIQVVDEKRFKKAMLRDAWRVSWEGIKLGLRIFLIPLFVLLGVLFYAFWNLGELAPVEVTASSYSEVFDGEIRVEVVDRDHVGPRRGGEGSIIRTKTDYSLIDLNENSWITCWEDVQIEFASNGTWRLFTATMPDGRTDYFIVADLYELGETDGWFKERLYPRQPEDAHHREYQDGLTAVLTQYCRENPEMAQDWNSIEFTFHAWSEDSTSVEFYYTTDTGLVGTVWYSLEGQESTGLRSVSYARAKVKR